MARPAIPEATRRQFEDTVARLRLLLPAGWRVDVASRTPDGGTVTVSNERDSGGLRLLALKQLEPRAVANLPDSGEPTAVASTWISPRTRELLRARGLGYVDGTGNVEIEMDLPGLVIRTTGADRNPNPKPTVGPTLRGPRAWALLRTLVEVTPPYGVRNLSEGLSVDAGYVSRVLKVLEGELLIERKPRGPITSVDWEGVLRQITSSYSLFRSNETSTWVAPGGPEQLLRDLSAQRIGQWVITGSFASSEIVPVAAPETAVIYTPDAERLATVARLLPATTGANVVLAVPYDEIVFERTRTAAKLTFVSPAQTAIDCLTGPGRMPEEGEALIAWMRRDHGRWQSRSLTALKAVG